MKRKSRTAHPPRSVSSGGKKVCLAGTFTVGVPIVWNAIYRVGQVEAVIKLPPGRHEYLLSWMANGCPINTLETTAPTVQWSEFGHCSGRLA